MAPMQVVDTLSDEDSVDDQMSGLLVTDLMQRRPRPVSATASKFHIVMLSLEVAW